MAYLFLVASGLERLSEPIILSVPIFPTDTRSFK